MGLALAVSPDDAAHGNATPIAAAPYSTDDIAPDRRHVEWAARGWPSVAALFESRPIGPFATNADRFDLDDLVVQYADGTARRFDRSPARARDDAFDVLGAGILFDGEMHGDARGRPFRAGPGSILLLDTGQPASFTIPTSRSIQLGIPRATAEELLGPVRALHGTVIAPDRAAMLVGHLLQLREALPGLVDHQRPRLARTVLDLLAIALDRGAPIAVAAPVGRREPSAAAARQEIEARLGLPSLTVAMLCQRLRISRSSLYRLFEADGGVEAYIRGRRLDQVRVALSDPANRDRIVDLAYRWGFSDASHLSRQFRDAYGVSPAAFRTAAVVGKPPA